MMVFWRRFLEFCWKLLHHFESLWKYFFLLFLNILKTLAKILNLFSWFEESSHLFSVTTSENPPVSWMKRLSQATSSISLSCRSTSFIVRLSSLAFSSHFTSNLKLKQNPEMLLSLYFCDKRQSFIRFPFFKLFFQSTRGLLIE